MADEEDVLDSWEDAADTGELEKRMEEREKAIKEKEKVEKEVKKSANTNQVTVLRQENSGRTEYTPQIKILKRQNGAGSPRDQRPAPEDARPTKTLAEREAEYAAARARILGSAAPQEDIDEPRKSILTKDSKLSKDSTDSTQKTPSNILQRPRPSEDTANSKHDR